MCSSEQGRLADRASGRIAPRDDPLVGPSYEFFAKLLPPLRYVDAAYLHYPIMLSAPGATTKARLISNGSAINALARKPIWRNETGVPVHFLVGDDREEFGKDLSRLRGARYLDGYLPIVQLA